MNELTPTLDQVPEEWAPRHLLLIGDSKTGKSTYAAQAAADGYLVIYVDSDNGISALRHRLKDNPEAMKRVIYLRTDRPYEFTYGLLTEGVFRWNMTQDKAYSSGMAKPSDVVLQVIPSLIPSTAILNIDSWTSTALDAMEFGASKKNIRLEDLFGNADQQGVYGDAGMKLTMFCAVIQHAKFHVIVQAHAIPYERYEKPLGSGAPKQKDMRLVETVKVPLSSSRPHGFNMVKYFNEVGWLEMDRTDSVVLDFTRKYGRVGGGTPAISAKIEKMSFAQLFGPVPDFPGIDSSWIEVMTSEDFVARKNASGGKPASKPAGVNDSGALKATPAKPQLSSLFGKSKAS